MYIVMKKNKTNLFICEFICIKLMQFGYSAGQCRI